MSATKMIELLYRCNTLKQIQRSGWITAGIQEKNYESVAGHSWGTCLISLLVSKQLLADGYDVDYGLVLELAIMHDIPEVVLTDIPHSAIDIIGQELNQAKKNSEKKAIESLLAPLEEVGEKIIEVLEISSDLQSIESRIVAGADILDMLVNAISFERNGVSPLILDSFFHNSLERIKSLGISILNDLHSILLKEHLKNLQNR